MLGMGLMTSSTGSLPAWSAEPSRDYHEEPAKKLPIRKFDVVVAGGGTAGAVAAIAAARRSVFHPSIGASIRDWGIIRPIFAAERKG